MTAAGTLQWRRASAFHIESDQGHRIARVGGHDGVRYSAFAPPVPDDAYRKQLRVRYAIGDTIPQRRRLLGCFASAEDAKAACEAAQ